jgi:hypothetical protein
VEAVSESVKNGEFDDLLNEAQDFARRQPAAFLGMAVLAGFGVVRFLKSSSEGASDGGHSHLNSPKSGAGNAGYRDDFSN